MTCIWVKDSSDPSPDRPAVTSDLLLWNGRPHMLRSLWEVYTSLNAHAQEIAHICDWIQVGTNGRPW